MNHHSQNLSSRNIRKLSTLQNAFQDKNSEINLLSRHSLGNDNVPVYFNVGGEEIPISLRNLKKYPESNLYALIEKSFSDDNFNSLESIYIDRDPKTFKNIANYYRYDYIKDPKNINKKIRLCSDIEYYGLHSLNRQINCRVAKAQRNILNIAKKYDEIDTLDEINGKLIGRWKINDQLYKVTLPLHPTNDPYNVILSQTEGSSFSMPKIKLIEYIQTYGIRGTEIILISNLVDKILLKK